MATIGSTDAARRAGARLATTATSIAIAPPTTYASVSTLLSEMPMFTALRRMRAAVRMSPTVMPGVVSFTTSNRNRSKAECPSCSGNRHRCGSPGRGRASALCSLPSAVDTVERRPRKSSGTRDTIHANLTPGPSPARGGINQIAPDTLKHIHD